ncbi:putative protein OS=Tsukamurella paurometabola (strain ATCC 8368 / DSM / CCUG 35730 /CIP 100753 / JCM 10117 / KCTC 9821 / NBRC 16120 / NCIMB 702349/ NCTC 13040) OX=521096 GN=Tpau_0912 PE=4 SV=1 [Tsukamurella paurometabola]|uniref:Uncharacterized protein n=1 Tax=Tsukamurella paurometabola (strain ATCC 8368 / DSM 20162 / CCUG 35730 / CIP 100753 / JCM 10117 / KCTC 9821 / NBRC 16120 / NCIMB 702349 / NCTC 13040) TaxID=521096 RepID=D5UUH5_TSUPD|nr:hypothetical protein [Tsukamurella paurometabola]ADG77546.1 hypothetical protein Tpau_0912 [Tsukamurella paurometabola DSM 20162]SUP27655.1 Uncharacterised protein [Tsukamurella paurometabola]
MSADENPGTATEKGAPRRFSPALLVAGLIALTIAVWGAAGGPSLISAGTLLAVVVIGAVAIAGLMLIIKPGKNSPTDQPPNTP